jgi:hypothetical protein
VARARISIQWLYIHHHLHVGVAQARDLGSIARAGSDGTETNAYAIATNFMAYLSCAVGRGVYLPIGNTRHHARLFCLHIGRSGRGRKGDAVSLVLRIDAALRALDDALLELANQVLAFLHQRGQATRSQISSECFRGKIPKARIDASLEHLLASTPPKITVQWGERADGAPGAPQRVYRLAAE